MKVLSALMSLTLAGSAFGQPSTAVSTDPVAEMKPLTITAERTQSGEIRKLELTRAAGGMTAAWGLGMTAYLAVAGGPVGWGLAILCAGGLTAYYAHGELKAYEAQARASPTRRKAGARPRARGRS